MSDTRKPAAKLGLSPVSAAIWRNQNPKGVFYSVTFERSYKDETGKYQTSPPSTRATCSRCRNLPTRPIRNSANSAPPTGTPDNRTKPAQSSPHSGRALITPPLLPNNIATPKEQPRMQQHTEPWRPPGTKRRRIRLLLVRAIPFPSCCPCCDSDAERYASRAHFYLRRIKVSIPFASWFMRISAAASCARMTRATPPEISFRKFRRLNLARGGLRPSPLHPFPCAAGGSGNRARFRTFGFIRVVAFRAWAVRP